jgi:membrane protein DedA with SNARE-associated domain
LGLAKYSPLKFASALFAGKFLLGEVMVIASIYFGRPFIEYLLAEASDPESLVTVAAIMMAITVVMIYYFIKIDWKKIVGKWFPWTLEKDKSSDSKDE